MWTAEDSGYLQARHREKQRTALGGGTSVMGERERVASWKAQNAVFQEVKTRSDQRS